jgi:hypothetical protein
MKIRDSAISILMKDHKYGHYQPAQPDLTGRGFEKFHPTRIHLFQEFLFSTDPMLCSTSGDAVFFGHLSLGMPGGIINCSGLSFLVEDAAILLISSKLGPKPPVFPRPFLATVHMFPKPPRLGQLKLSLQSAA